MWFANFKIHDNCPDEVLFWWRWLVVWLVMVANVSSGEWLMGWWTLNWLSSSSCVVFFWLLFCRLKSISNNTFTYAHTHIQMEMHLHVCLHVEPFFHFDKWKWFGLWKQSLPTEPIRCIQCKKCSRYIFVGWFFIIDLKLH